jgi:hypothetical protein
VSHVADVLRQLSICRVDRLHNYAQWEISFANLPIEIARRAVGNAGKYRRRKWIRTRPRVPQSRELKLSRQRRMRHTVWNYLTV